MNNIFFNIISLEKENLDNFILALKAHHFSNEEKSKITVYGQYNKLTILSGLNFNLLSATEKIGQNNVYEDFPFEKIGDKDIYVDFKIDTDEIKKHFIQDNFISVHTLENKNGKIWYLFSIKDKDEYETIVEPFLKERKLNPFILGNLNNKLIGLDGVITNFTYPENLYDFQNALITDKYSADFIIRYGISVSSQIIEEVHIQNNKQGLLGTLFQRGAFKPTEKPIHPYIKELQHAYLSKGKTIVSLPMLETYNEAENSLKILFNDAN